MRLFSLLWLFAAAIAANALPSRDEVRKFPEDFLFGTATASYQIEGGWNADDKGENIWDHMTHNHPDAIKDMSNGDIAADSYNNYKRDVEMMRELGLDAYRFSLSWSRILPTGMSNEISEAGVAFYNNYIDEMLKYNIVPMITLYHWDLPQKLQELGGFTNPLIADWYEDYARVVFEKFGDRVKHWITFNEPREICYEGYDFYTKAPRVNASAIGCYLCAKNLVMAHAKAYHLYDKEFRETQNGNIGITISVNWFGPATDSEEDEYAAEISRQAWWGLYAEPIFGSEGGFPKLLAERVAEKSKAQGYIRSRMPEFTDEERDFVKGASDFFGVNHYSGILVTGEDNGAQPHTFLNDIGFENPKLDLPTAASSWLQLFPDSIYYALTDLNERYKNQVYYITENGWSIYPGDPLADDDRITYYRAAWESVLKTLDAGVDLRGYMAWSLMDNFEWMEGYTERFGLYAVDFEDPGRKRTARKSALVYKQLIKTRYIDYEYDPQDFTIAIDEGH